MRHSPSGHTAMATRRAAAPRPATARPTAPRSVARPKPGPRDTDPPERAEPRAQLPALIERFRETLAHPVQAAIAPHALHALVEFAKIHRRPGRTVTFAWIDLDALLEATPVEGDPDRAGPGLAAAYFSVLASFYRWRAQDGALERAVAERLASKLLGFAGAMREIERRGGTRREGS